MALPQRLEIRQSHALVMTPQLMQAIKLLQLSNLDLAAYVEGELERNPLLERIGEGDGEGDRRPPDREGVPVANVAPPDTHDRAPGRKESAAPGPRASDFHGAPPPPPDGSNS